MRVSLGRRQPTMVTTLWRYCLLLLITALVVWWVVLIVSFVRSFLRGDTESGVVALVMFGLLIGALGAGITGYRRFQIAWQKRTHDQE